MSKEAQGSEFEPGEWPEYKSDPLSFSLFSWLNPLFRFGHKNTLEIHHLYKLQNDLQVRAMADQFEALWRDQQAAYELSLETTDTNPEAAKPSVVRILIKMIGRKYLTVGALKFVSDIGFCSAPLLMKALISFIQHSSSAQISAGPGYGYAIGIFVISMISSVCFGFFFQRCNKFGMIVRGVLTAVVYRKSLRLSGAARQEFNAGRITNIISTDLVRLDLFMVFFHLAWSYMLQTTYVIALLLWVLGPSSLAGISMLLITVPLQMFIIKALVALRKQNAGLTDQRVRLTSESLSSIRIIKFFAWEDSFLSRVADIRSPELKAVINANLIRSVITASGFALPVLAASISFAVYFVISPVFDTVAIFTSLALFNNLRNPIQWSPIIIGVYADAKVAIERIQALLESPELTFEPEYVTNSADTAAVVVENGDFVWETTGSLSVEDVAIQIETEEHNVVEDAAGRSTPTSTSLHRLSRNFDSEAQLLSNAILLQEIPKTSPLPSIKSTISNLNFTIPEGSLVAIVGAVGSGKSSLLSALVGQLKPTNTAARVQFSGSVGFAPQQPWIMNTSLKENILFGLPFNQERYDAAIDACALRKDLAVLSGGDAAEIGEKGINLSGGQKQRVSLARLVYFDSSIVLMDDPLSAVDAHVGKHIFENCIQTAMKSKTRLLVTHQLHFVPQCDLVMTLKDGHISEFGSYKELMNNKGDFYELMNSYGGIASESEDQLAEASENKTKEKVEDSKVASKGETALIKAEERGEGGVKTSIFVSFAIAMGGTGFLIFMLTVLVLAQGAKVTNDLWLVFWTNNSLEGLSTNQYLYIYLGLGLTQAVFLVLFSILIAIGAIRAAKDLHEKALNRVFHAPVTFFDTNPLGRILNRFSRDQDIIDNTLPDGIRLFLITFGTAISTFTLVTVVTGGWFLILLIPLMAVYYHFQAVYRSNARELKRLDALTRSPLYAHVSESMTGVATIRAYRVQPRFISKTDTLIDTNNTPYYLQTTGARWLGIRLEIIGNLLILFTALFGVISRETINPAMIGLALSYVLQVTQLLSLCIRQFTDAEVQLVSIERMNYYASHIETEPPGTIDSTLPPQNWPSEGKIEFDNLSMRYQPHLPLVLTNITLNINKHEKVGVVGRTGSGKSSLMLSLFRILEADVGSIKIDGIDISTLGVKDLRSRLSIIPQDPILFSGTVRSNLDPFNEHQDHDIWTALESSGMKLAITAMEGGLNAPVDSLGENLSVGQRQLLCLSRAILRSPKLLVLDECTANVDLETDHLIQQALRSTMSQTTILTIAHRLNTVMDYDKILVLDAGKVVEYDTPRALLEREGGVFAGMVMETGPTNSKALRGMVGLP
ncbi:P-loop containing nucleoside triphosphate hydrolase protein [Rhizoclosmatium globosum]|uniref:p-loop containing nucleoside triphosphate hydrolase protein n=1 Tax=Rhizoclosmatium globosum TaxID=329046 RepID=A0A1Y2CKG9_9FUNG|nr:P-loop containing nucleoside triphosphate hydrolase protein [Rhizoclosmatium globosum]|eukprot:ORY47490.1 P-loop containing nucleoside triphosphate hydrolase protein [Rhizoclosmatium globosum]